MLAHFEELFDGLRYALVTLGILALASFLEVVRARYSLLVRRNRILATYRVVVPAIVVLCSILGTVLFALTYSIAPFLKVGTLGIGGSYFQFFAYRSIPTVIVFWAMLMLSLMAIRKIRRAGAEGRGTSSSFSLGAFQNPFFSALLHMQAISRWYPTRALRSDFAVNAVKMGGQLVQTPSPANVARLISFLDLFPDPAFTRRSIFFRYVFGLMQLIGFRYDHTSTRQLAALEFSRAMRRLGAINFSAWQVSAGCWSQTYMTGLASINSSDGSRWWPYFKFEEARCRLALYQVTREERYLLSAAASCAELNAKLGYRFEFHATDVTYRGAHSIGGYSFDSQDVETLSILIETLLGNFSQANVSVLHSSSHNLIANSDKSYPLIESGEYYEIVLAYIEANLKYEIYQQSNDSCRLVRDLAMHLVETLAGQQGQDGLVERKIIYIFRLLCMLEEQSALERWMASPGGQEEVSRLQNLIIDLFDVDTILDFSLLSARDQTYIIFIFFMIGFWDTRIMPTPWEENRIRSVFDRLVETLLRARSADAILYFCGQAGDQFARNALDQGYKIEAFRCSDISKARWIEATRRGIGLGVSHAQALLEMDRQGRFLCDILADGTYRSTNYQEIYRHLDVICQYTSDAGGHRKTRNGSDFSQLTKLLADNSVSAAFYFLMTGSGCTVMIIRPDMAEEGEVESLELAEVYPFALHRMIYGAGGWLEGFRSFQDSPSDERASWSEQVRSTSSMLGTFAMNAVAEWLRQQNVAEGAEIALIMPGIMTLLPWTGAILDDGSSFFEHWAASVSPSLDSLVESLRARSQADRSIGRVYGAVDPRGDSFLSASAIAEIGNVTSVTGGALHVGSDCAKQAVLRNIEANNVVYIMAHAWWNPSRPLESYIEVARPSDESDEAGARLSVGDLLSVPLKSTRVVLLGACHSGLPGLVIPNEAIGLPGALQAAGAPAVIASLWPVFSFGTHRVLMDVINGIQAGLSPAASLRRAQLAVIQGSGEVTDSLAANVALGVSLSRTGQTAKVDAIDAMSFVCFGC